MNSKLIYLLGVTLLLVLALDLTLEHLMLVIEFVSTLTASLIGLMFAFSMALGIGTLMIRLLFLTKDVWQERMAEQKVVKNQKAQKPKLHKAPFRGARSIFSFLFSRKTYSVIEEAILDCETEYNQDLKEGAILRSFRTKILGWLIITKTAVAQLGVSLISLMVKLWKMSS